MKVKFYTLGCKVNQYESQAMTEQLLNNGYTLAQGEEKADVIIVNLSGEHFLQFVVGCEVKTRGTELFDRELHFLVVKVLGCAVGCNVFFLSYVVVTAY